MVAKLTDVAKLAGVSPTTVSRVINKKGYLSEKTIQKVNEAMRELGYKPNNLARSLQGKSAKLIGLIFPNISNVFYAELIDKLEHQLFKNGYKTPSSATVNMILRRNANTSKCWKPIR
ncbi:transcriptional regulator [Streptococcus pneumoniae]|nr:transcriptional regulator [Streptococcus pneumoniae]